MKCVDLHKTFQGLVALESVTCEFPERSISALVGPNGAGKTTLLNVVSGVLEPQKGQVWLLGSNVAGLPFLELARRGVWRSFQDVQLPWTLNVIESVCLSSSPTKYESFWRAFQPWRNSAVRSIDETAVASIDAVGIDEATRVRAVQALSFGEQRLAYFACALAFKPSVLLLDEPFSGLSTEASLLLQNLMRMLAQDGCTIVVVHHGVAVLRTFVDHVVALSNGRVAAEGSVSEVLREDVLRGL